MPVRDRSMADRIQIMNIGFILCIVFVLMFNWQLHFHIYLRLVLNLSNIFSELFSTRVKLYCVLSECKIDQTWSIGPVYIQDMGAESI